MATLKEDLAIGADWIVKAFAADGIQLDYTIGSFQRIDRFIDQHARNGEALRGGRLDGNVGKIAFALAGYIGETFIRKVPGTIWVTDDQAPDGEANVTLVFPDGAEIWPVHRLMKRIRMGAEESIYVYGFYLQAQLGDLIVKEDFVVDAPQADHELPEARKPWWKFW